MDRGSQLSTLVVTLQEQVLGEQITAGQLTELNLALRQNIQSINIVGMFSIYSHTCSQ